MVVIPNLILALEFDYVFILCTFTAIATVVTVAEILKNNGLAVEKSKISPSSIFLFLSSCLLLILINFNFSQRS